MENLDETIVLKPPQKFEDDPYDITNRFSFRKIWLKFLLFCDSEEWRILILFTICINYLFTSYVFIFGKDYNNQDQFFVAITCDTFFAIDYISALSTYCWRKIHPQLFNLPRNTLTIIFDLLLVVPSYYIYEMAAKKINHFTSTSLRIIIFLRLFHVVEYFSTKNQTPGINHFKYFTLQYLFYLTIIYHSMACGWYLMIFDEASFTIIQQKFHVDKPWKVYIMGSYFTVDFTTNSAFGDVSPKNLDEISLAILAMCLGYILVTGIYTGMLTSHIVNANMNKAFFRKQFFAIKKYLNSIKIDALFLKKIITYYDTLWEKKNGIQKVDQMTILPYSLTTEICFDLNYRALTCSTIFRDKPEAFLRSVSHLMQHRFYQTHEIIYHQNVIKSKMIYVVVGQVAILSDEDNESPILTLGPGSCLGESSLVLTSPARASVRAACYAELQLLYREDFLTLIDLYPQIFMDIREKIIERVSRAQAEHLRYEESHTIELNRFVSRTERSSIIKTIKNKLNRVTPINPNEDSCLTLYKIGENLAHNGASALCLSEKFPWIIQPKTSLAWVWEGLIILVAVSIGVLYPYYMVFVRKFPGWMRILSNILEGVLVIDIYVILSTAIVEKRGNVKTMSEILRKNLTKVGFYLDFLSCVYLEVLCHPFILNDRIYYLLKANRLLKTYRVCYLFDVLENSVNLPVLPIRILKYIVYLLICSYWFGMVLYLITCFNPVCLRDGWFLANMIDDIKNSVTHPCTLNENTMSAYFAISCLSGTSFGDITPKNLLEIVVVMIIHIIGTLLFGFCIAQLSATVTLDLTWKIHFQQSFFALERFIKKKKVGNMIEERVVNFFQVQWYYDEGTVLQRQSLFYNANQEIKEKMQLREKFSTVKALPFFERASYDLLRLISNEAKTLILPPNEVITHDDQKMRKIYIIQSGHCMQFLGKTKNVVGPGAYYGSIGVLADMASPCTIVTITHVKIIYIEEEVFWRSISMFPTTFREFTSTIQGFDFKRYRANLIKDEEIQKISFLKIRGSFINVLSYCRKNDEIYGEPFKKLGLLSWLKFVLPPVCIIPTGFFLKFWMTFRLIVSLFTVLMTSVQLMKAAQTATLDIILSICDCLAWLDLVLMMFVGFYGQKKQLIVHPVKTMGHYISGRFILDLFVCFPFEIIFVMLTAMGHRGNYHFFHCSLRASRFGQIYRIPEYFNYFQNNIKRKGNFIEIVKFLVLSLLFLHLCSVVILTDTCTFYTKNDFEASDKINDSFVQPQGMAGRRITSEAVLCEIDSLFDRSKYRDYYGLFEVYIFSLYFSTDTLTGVGLGDITPQYLRRLILTILMILCGVLFRGYIYAKISSSKVNTNELLSKNRVQLKDLKRYMKREAVPRPVRKKIIENVEFKWKRSGGAQPKKILENLHTALHGDVVLNMYEETLNSVSIFKNLNRVFFRSMGMELKEVFFHRREVILKRDDIVKKIFFIERGRVEVSLAEGIMHISMGAGGAFGNISPSKKTKINVKVTAVTDVDCLAIDQEVFYKILKKYPTYRTTIDVTLAKNSNFIEPTKSQIEEVESSLHWGAWPIERGEYKKSGISCLKLFLPWKWFTVAIAPDSHIYTFLEYFTAIMAFFNSIVASYEFAFQHHTNELLYIAIAVDCLFIIRVLIDLHKAFENEFGELIISNERILKRILKQYKLSLFIIITANLPLPYFAFLVGLIDKSTNVYLNFSSLRLITLLRLIFIYKFYEKRSNSLNTDQFWLRVSYITIWCILVLHIFVCILYILACPLTFCYSNSWVNSYNLTHNKTKPELYLLTMYFNLEIFTTTGPGDILPSTINEIIFLILIMILASFIIGIFIGEVLCAYNSHALSCVEYEYKINELKQYIQNQHVSKFQFQKMWTYVKKLWMENGGKQVPELVCSLPYVLRCELTLRIYGHHLLNSYVFKDTELSFIRQLCIYFVPKIFFSGNYVVQHGDSDKSMYFIHSGEVDILTVNPDLTETIHYVLETGDMFGLSQGLFHGVSHHFSFRARTTTHVLGLCLSDWEDLLNFFPVSKEIIYRKASENSGTI